VQKAIAFSLYVRG